jgi:hypothetical protein
MYSTASWSEAEKLMSDDLQLVDFWFRVHGLSVNFSKTNCIGFRLKYDGDLARLHVKCHDQNCKKVICGCPTIQNADSVLYLGILFDYNMKFISHIINMNKIGRNFLRNLIFLRDFCQEKILVQLYQSLFVSRVSYGICVWGGSYATHLKSLTVTQKYCMRIIGRKSRLDHSFPLFLRFNQLPLRHLYLYKTLFVFFMRSGQFVPGPRNTRMGNRYPQPRAHKSIFEKSFPFIGARMANIFCSAVNMDNLRNGALKRLIKKWLLDQTVNDLEMMMQP